METKRKVVKEMNLTNKSTSEQFISKKKEPDILISVIIPVYNAEKYLKTCLNSIINQIYENLEIICVDDGSTDHSLDILRFYEKKDKRIKVYTQKNSGPSAARNNALNHATGEYISFVDADDFLVENAYKILAEVAVEKEKWDLIIFGGNVVGERNDYIADKLSTKFRTYKECEVGDVVFNEKAARPFLWLHFIKRDLLEKPTVLRFDESLNLGEDQIFQFGYVPRAKNVITLELKLYNYRIEKNASLMQLYSNRRVSKTECHFTIVEKVIKEWKDFGYYEENQDKLSAWIVEFLYYTIWEFPAELKKQYAERFLQLLKKYDVKECLIPEYRQGLLAEFKEWALNDMTAEEELKDLIKKTEREKYEIEETLKSKAFKIGRFFTKKKNRINI